ncbi:probable phage associated protein [gamma proteobacterium HdN1]|nr:Conserved hypothetical protein [gamma proteobacterium HdN1]CBL47091.1 probable phage associated protein [gamma proteobacterium HdN1]
MAAYHDLIDEKDRIIRYISRVSIGLLIGLVLAIFGWMRAQHEITVYQPPDIRLHTVSSAGYIPEETVYAFVPLIMQQLYLWDNGGDQDYENNRYRVRQFLTDKYQRTILDEIETGKLRGTLKGLQRRLQVLPSSVYSDSSVEVVGNYWRVWIDVKITDSIKNMKVNDGVHRLAVRVVRYDINRDANPWQLAIDGIEQDIPLVSAKTVPLTPEKN